MSSDIEVLKAKFAMKTSGLFHLWFLSSIQDKKSKQTSAYRLSPFVQMVMNCPRHPTDTFSLMEASDSQFGMFLNNSTAFLGLSLLVMIVACSDF